VHVKSATMIISGVVGQKGLAGRTLQFSNRQLQSSDRRDMGAQNLSSCPQNPTNCGIFRPEFGIFERTFSTCRKFSGRQKFTGLFTPPRGVIPHRLATTPLVITCEKVVTKTDNVTNSAEASHRTYSYVYRSKWSLVKISTLRVVFNCRPSLCSCSYTS